MATQGPADIRKQPATRVLLLIAVLGVGAGVSATPPDAILVVPAHVDPGLEDLSGGLSQHLHQRLASAGVAAIDGAEVRSARTRRGTSMLTTQEALSIAAGLGAQRVAILDLRAKQGLVETVIRLYQGSPPRLRGIARDTAPLEELAASADRALTPLLTPLDALTSSLSHRSPPSLGTVASLNRALEHLDGGRLIEAWTELQDRDGSAVSALRRQIRTAASARTTGIAERASLMAATGEMDSAWKQIADAAGSGSACPATLVAAGEVQLERGELDSARYFFERALSTDPGNTRASLGLARTYGLAMDDAAARKVLEGAAARQQGRSDPRVLEELSRHQTDSPRLQAHLLVLAGRLNVERLDSQRALDDLRRAVELDPERAYELELMLAALGDEDVDLPRDPLAMLVSSFAERGSGSLGLGFLGMRHGSDLRDWRTWLDPRSMDTDALDERIAELLQQTHALDTAAGQEDRGTELEKPSTGSTTSRPRPRAIREPWPRSIASWGPKPPPWAGSCAAPRRSRRTAAGERSTSSFASSTASSRRTSASGPTASACPVEKRCTEPGTSTLPQASA